jgi:hypothetical protein
LLDRQIAWRAYISIVKSVDKQAVVGQCGKFLRTRI